MLMVGIFSTGIQKERDKNASWMVFLGSIYPLAKVFRLILDFMRSDVLPPRACFMKVYNEALYLSFDYLIGKISTNVEDSNNIFCCRKTVSYAASSWKRSP